MVKSELSKTSSNLMKDINRIKKYADKLTRMNILRKHQIQLHDKLFQKLLREEKITKAELKKYNPKKKDSGRKLFS